MGLSGYLNMWNANGDGHIHPRTDSLTAEEFVLGTSQAIVDLVIALVYKCWNQHQGHWS